MVPKKRLLPMVFCILLLTLLTACRLDFTKDKSSVREMVKSTDGITVLEEKKEEAAESSSEKKEKPTYTIEGSVTLDSTHILLKGKTDLPPEAIMYTRLLAYPKDASLKDIKAYRAKPYMKVISEDYMSVEADGSFQSTELERPDFPQRYRLDVLYSPVRAEESMQKKLVKEGEGIEDLKGMVRIDLPARNEFLDDVVQAYVKQVNIMQFDEQDGDGVTLELVEVEKVE
ncbi:hypothetical protein [[Bacillus] enclensis]|uniref:hypothetical protein n=1 Tax=[Bacillus] enclensis TaxID=1402860 RepID=UPI0018DE22FB|nr:hypothetical protein [[Bacillus] enclensis]MBH9964819.1 hypothetical protein [[Bacillus] enclensis]